MEDCLESEFKLLVGDFLVFVFNFLDLDTNGDGGEDTKTHAELLLMKVLVLGCEEDVPLD